MMEDNTQTVLEKVKCREIVGEILDFGVSQEQIKNKALNLKELIQ